MFWLNFGEEVDPSDLPSFVSWLRLRLNVTTARALYDMGLPLRGRRMAKLLGAGSTQGCASLTLGTTDGFNPFGVKTAEQFTRADGCAAAHR